MKKIVYSIVVILVMLLAAFGIYKFTNNKDNSNSKVDVQNQINEKIEPNKYEVSNYATIDEKKLKSGKILDKKVSFKNISSELIESNKKYNEEYNNFDVENAFNSKTNTFLETDNELYLDIIDDSLVYFEKEDTKLDEFNMYEYYMNDFVYDLKRSTCLSNDNVLDKYHIDKDKFLSDVIINMVKTIKIDNLLVGTDGDVMAEKVTLTSLEDNKDKYVEILRNEINDDNLFRLKLEKSEQGIVVSIYYFQSKVLEKLNLCSHMGYGLVLEPIVLKYTEN